MLKMAVPQTTRDDEQKCADPVGPASQRVNGRARAVTYLGSASRRDAP